MFGLVARFFDPLAFLLVFGGTARAVVVPATGAELRRVFAALGPLLLARP